MEKLIECVPNFSTSDKNIIKYLLDVLIQSGVKILDLHIDPDHNRSVITFMGSPDLVEIAGFEVVKKAVDLINLKEHKGEHPRVGVTDVFPLIPLKGITTNECIEVSKKLGRKIGNELKIPVYLYEKAASTKKRINLAYIRNKGFEKLKNLIYELEDFKPDFGPAKLSNKGALMIGVRDILIAYNINISTSNIEVVKKIAKKIRESSGGLKGVKALGVYLKSRNLTQVTMNLVDYKIMGLKKVFEEVEKELKGIKIISSEIVGMVPKDAVWNGFKKDLKLEDFRNEQVLDIL